MIKIATKIYNEVEVTLQDDTDVLLRPLPIGRLRRFTKAWEKFEDLEEEAKTNKDEIEDKTYDIFIECSGIALENNFKGKFESLRGPEGLSDEYREYLEDVLDMETIYEIMEVCGGIKLRDPKLMEALEKANREAAGTN